MNELESDGGASIEKVTIFLPDNYITSEEVSLTSGIPNQYFVSKLGVNKKYQAKADITSSQMALTASETCLRDFDKDSIDLVIWTGSGEKDRDTWMASIHVIKMLGLKNAWGIDIFAQSACDVIALRLAKSILASDRSINRILITGGHLISRLIDYCDKKMSFLMNFSDGAGAVVIGRGNFNSILGSSTVADASFSDDVIISIKERKDRDEVYLERKFTLDSKDGFKSRLTEVSIANYYTTIVQSCRLSGNQDSLDFLFLNHLSPKIHNAILSKLNMNQSQSRYLNNFGHVGSLDPWISLSIAEDEQVLGSGDLVCLASAGLGYTWSATCITWNCNLVGFYRNY